MVPSNLMVVNCTTCQNLKQKLLEQIKAFKTLANVNTELSWTVLVKSLEGILTTDPHEIGTEDNVSTADRADPTNLITEEKRTKSSNEVENIKVQKELKQVVPLLAFKDDSIKSELSPQVDKIMVTNPFQDFNLQQALKAHVKLDRLNISGDPTITLTPRVISKSTPTSPKSIESVPVTISKQKSTLKKSQENGTKKRKKKFKRKLFEKRKTLKVKTDRLNDRPRVITRDKAKKKIKGASRNKTIKVQNSLFKPHVPQQQKDDDDDLMLVDDAKDECYPYQGMPEMTLQIYDDDNQDINMDDDLSTSTPPLLTPVQLDPWDCVECKNDENQSQEPVVIANEGPQVDEIKSILDGHKNESSTGLQSPTPSMEPTEPTEKVERASLDEVDSKIFAKVDMSNTNGGVTFHCTDCPKMYHNVTGARRHIRLVHFHERKTCVKNCGKRFYDVSRLKKHEETCKGPQQ